MHHTAALPAFLPITQQEVAAGAFLEHKSEIFAGVHRRNGFQHALLAKYLQRQRFGELGLLVAVGQHRIGVKNLNLAAGAVAFGGKISELLDPLNQQVANFRLHRPHAQLHHHVLGDDVGGDTRLESTDAHHRGFARRYVTGNDTLQIHHQRRAGHNGVDGALGVRAVAAVTGNGDFDRIRRGHKITGVKAEFPHRQARHIVQAEDALAGETFKQAVFNH